MYFSKDIAVDVHDIDFNGVVKASAIMKYMQSAANDQLSANGMSYDDLIEQNKAFILSKIKIDLKEPLYAFDRIKSETFPCDSYGYTFLRCYQITRDEKVVAMAASIWALVDIQKHSLVRVKNFDLGLETHAPLAELSLERIHIPTEISHIGEFKVNYGDIDQNNHMNNTRYPDMYSSFLPLNKKRIKTITIDYINEACSFETLKVMNATAADGTYYFQTVKENGNINSVAEITLTDI